MTIDRRDCVLQLTRPLEEVINSIQGVNNSIELEIVNYLDRLKIRKGSIVMVRDNARSQRCQIESESRREKDILGALIRGLLNNHRHGT